MTEIKSAVFGKTVKQILKKIPVVFQKKTADFFLPFTPAPPRIAHAHAGL